MNNRLSIMIKERRAHISVIGLGHVGLPQAAVFADVGYSVIGSDANSEVVEKILSSKLETHEHGLDELVKKVVKSGRLKVTNDTASAVRQADVVLICVQTPLDGSKKRPDTKFLESATRDVARELTKGKLVVVESTVPPGTMANLVRDILESESRLKCGLHFELAYCPERILPGNTIKELKENDRVVGGFDTQSITDTVELFGSLTKGKIRGTTVENAELAKLAENTFRYINIGFANELALICEEMGADVVEVTNLANSHPRVNIHRSGPGVGGPCLTKDPLLLLNPQGRKPLDSKLILCLEGLNSFMASHIVDLVVGGLRKEGKEAKNSCVAVLGVAYKAGVSDTLESPAEKIIHSLMCLGAQVKTFDPYTEESFGAESTENLRNAVDAADCVVIGTDHSMFADLPFKELRKLMKRSPIIVDARRIVDFGEAKREGFTYYGIGLGQKQNLKPFARFLTES